MMAFLVHGSDVVGRGGKRVSMKIVKVKVRICQVLVLFISLIPCSIALAIIITMTPMNASMPLHVLHVTVFVLVQGLNTGRILS